MWHRTISTPPPSPFLPSLHLSLFTLLLGVAPSIISLPSAQGALAHVHGYKREYLCATLRIERTEFAMERGVRLVSRTVPSYILVAILLTWNVSYVRSVLDNICRNFHRLSSQRFFLYEPLFFLLRVDLCSSWRYLIQLERNNFYDVTEIKYYTAVALLCYFLSFLFFIFTRPGET